MIIAGDYGASTFPEQLGSREDHILYQHKFKLFDQQNLHAIFLEDPTDGYK